MLYSARNLVFLLFFLVSKNNLIAQTNTKSKIKKLCNPLVSGQPSTKALSLVYEIQPVHSGQTLFPLSNLPVEYTTNSLPVQSLRLNYNKYVVMKPKLYVTFTAGYWFSNFNSNNATNNSFAGLLHNTSWHSVTVGTNIFKPLNEKNFVLLNLSIEANGNGTAFKNFSKNNLLAGGAAIYGWKKGFQTMWGLGVFRGYRLGKLIHVPALLYNSSFNKKWGIDALFPARANFRYRPSAKNQWYFGYELDGTQFAINSTNTFYNNQFLQRGEIRPKLGFEKQFRKNWAFTCNTGLRINGRFDVSSDYAGKNIKVESNPKPSLFINGGIHMLNFPKKKKTKK